MASSLLIGMRIAPRATRAGPRALFRHASLYPRHPSLRYFSASQRWKSDTTSDATQSKPAGDLHQVVTEEEKSHYDKRVAEDTSKQIRTPWMREGSDRPPVATQRSAGAMTKGESRILSKHSVV